MKRAAAADAEILRRSLQEDATNHPPQGPSLGSRKIRNVPESPEL